jgi:hypothetical protein
MIVYLDSQDYSHLSAPPRGKEAFFEALSQDLTRLLDRGAIEIRYSAIHVSEMAHTSATAMKFSVPRAEVLKQFCRGKCMRYWQFVAEDEAVANFHPTGIVSTNDDDRWFETDMNTITDLADQFNKELNDALAQKGANRKMRRKANTFNLGRHLTETEQGRALLENFANNLNERFSLAKPISIDVLRDYALGPAGTKKFREYLRGVMFDPLALMAQLTPEFDSQGRLPKVVRDQGRILVEKLNPGIEKVTGFVGSLSREPMFEPLWRDIRLLPDKMKVEIRRLLIRSMMKDIASKLPQQYFPDETIDGLRMPIADTLANIMGRFLKQAVSAAEAGKPVRLFHLSDAPDLLHAVHIPYVDIFRCDTAWMDTLVPEGQKHGTDIIGRIENLLPAIEKRLGS